MKKYTLIIIILVLVVGALAFVGGFGRKSKELKTMLESSVANMQLVTAQEVNRAYSDKRTTLGIPIYAGVGIRYEPVENYTKEDVYKEIVKNIENNNWVREDSGGQGDYYRAYLPYESFREGGSRVITVGVFNHSERSTVDITMGHGIR